MMKRGTLAREGLVALGCVLALVLFVCGTATAQGYGSAAKGSETKAAAGEKSGEMKSKAEGMGSDWGARSGYMMDMAKIDKLLAEAKKAAQAGKSDEAVVKIDQAQNLIEERHQAMHKHMMEKMEKMEKAGDEKGAAEMKHSLKDCPLCQEHHGQAGSGSK